MTEHERGEQRRVGARLLMSRAEDSLAAAEREKSLSPYTSLNRAFYACFYAASAVLLVEGREFTSHSGVRAALHRDFVKPGRLAADLGRVYDEMFEDRSEADYAPTAVFTPEDAAAAIEKATRFVEALRALLPPGIV